MKLDTFYKKLARYLPLGLDARATFRQLALAFVLAAGFSLGALISIFSQYECLFYEEGAKKILYEGIKMAMFAEIVPPWLIVFPIIAMGAILLAVYYYVYHRQESMSIYTMRRLPEKRELHIRCLTVPIVTALLALALGALLMLLYYAVYMWLVPAECIVPGQLRFLISELFGGIV